MYNTLVLHNLDTDYEPNVEFRVKYSYKHRLHVYFKSI